MADDPEAGARAAAGGADLDAQVFNAGAGTVGGNYPAIYVAALKNRLRALRWLVAAGADPNADVGSADHSSSGRRTPCYVACLNRRHGAVRALVALGARPDHSTWTDSDKCTCPADIPHTPGCKCVQCKKN